MPLRLSAATVASLDEKQDVRGSWPRLMPAVGCRCCHRDRRIPVGAWQAGGAPGLASKGQAARCRLDRDQLAELDRVPYAGPAAAGWEDQRWTLVRDLIGREFGL